MKRRLFRIVCIGIAVFVLTGCLTQPETSKPEIEEEVSEKEMNDIKDDEEKDMERYDRNTLIFEVRDDPVFEGYGDLIFPVDTGYMSGRTLGNLSLTWYSNIDPDKTVEEAIEIGVQVNGKFRGTVKLPVDCEEDLAIKTALAEQRIQNAIGDKQVVKTIVVKNKIISLIVK